MKIGTAKKKPVFVDFMIYEGPDNADEIREWIGKSNLPIDMKCLVIPTLEGNMRAKPGDYIIKGVEGEFYPCKPDIFMKTYEICE